jgi:hypothetical protein
MKDRLSIIVTCQIIVAIRQHLSSSDLFLTESFGWHSHFYQRKTKHIKISRGTSRLNPQKTNAQEACGRYRSTT